ncbi:hypothetical protein G3578_04745 [Brevibacillus sp. SYP-B805]|uniref:YcdB/YcdC domain-containing protein n=1 Tax=Brevibacillus sp. SYP-B805 TaxID=1578199 RepID=UPI0013ECDC38|nr:YcdB/YcdC domain-containing protein [Brevibacillus sp. SYP-B805]NGQ94486.1 hypothetical protein [Brevibacillus sp. SYP-B805]
MRRGFKAFAVLTALSLLTAAPVGASSSSPLRELTAKQEWLQKLEQAQPRQGKKDVRPLSIKKLPVEMKQALDRLTAVLPELAGLSVEEAAILEGEDGEADRWEYWLTNSEDEEAGYISAHVTLNAETGTLTSYRIANEHWISRKPPSDELAIRKASQFLENVAGKDPAQYRAEVVPTDEDEDAYEYEPSDDRAYVHFDRLLHNIPVRGFSISVSVDEEGHVIRYHEESSLEIDESSVPEPTDVLSARKAKEAYTRLLGMHLVYNRYEPLEDDHDDDDEGDKVKTKPVLKYVPLYEGPMDASTGEIPDDIFYWKEQEPKTIALSPKGKKLTARSQKAAETLLKQEFGFDMDSMELEEQDVYGESPERWKLYVWHTKKDVRPSATLYLRVNASSGAFRSFSYYITDTDKTAKPISKKKALGIATATLEKYLPSSNKEVQLTESYPSDEYPHIPPWVEDDDLETDGETEEYEFAFHPLYQGVPIENDSYFLTIDARTGKVVGFFMNTDSKKVTLPANKGTVSPQKAADAYLKHRPLELVYIWPQYDGQRAPKPLLVYVPQDNPYGYIDAFTGKVVERDKAE